METEIVFCERCGVSIPESEVPRVRQASGGKDLCPNCVHPRREADGDLRLYFCENCRVSIAVTDVLTGLARPDGTGYLCSVCTRATPAERVTRRTAVERELHAAGAPAAPARAPGADPIYFCDVCTSSIPATHVATGRALVQGGRTLCERCGARPGAGRIHEPQGPGALPVVAAALLAAAMGAGGFALWQEWGGAASSSASGPSDGDALAALRRESARDRADSAAALTIVTTKTETALRALEARVDAALAEARSAKKDAAAKGSGSDALVDRVDETNSRIDDLEDEMRALRGSVAGGRGLPAEPSMPSAPAAEEMPPAESEPDPAPAGGADPGPMAAKDPSDSVKRCVALLKDKEIGVRFAAALELGKIAGKRAPSGEGAATETADFDYAWPALALSLRKDDDAFVRRACARSLGEIKAWDSFPDLADSLLDPEEYVALQASRVIKEMAGQDFGFRQNQAKADRKRVGDRAKKWWDENKDRIAR